MVLRFAGTLVDKAGLRTYNRKLECRAIRERT